MYNRIYVNYGDIVQNESLVIDFLAKNSDSFSFNPIIKKPYSQMPPYFIYAEKLLPFIIKYIFEKQDWPVDFLGQLKHQIMVVCRCCKGSRKQLLEMPNLFLLEDNDIPEDICFYRNGKLWFGSITHERISFFTDITNEEVLFFQKNNIKINI